MKSSLIIFSCILISISLFGQQLHFRTWSGQDFYTPVSVRSEVNQGYLPIGVNLLELGYKYHDLRPNPLICAPMDSVLAEAGEFSVIVNDEWPCFTDNSIFTGSLIIIPVDSSKLSSARLPFFDHMLDELFDSYVVAVSNQAFQAIEPHINNLEYVVFLPGSDPIYSNVLGLETFHVAQDTELKLPCIPDSIQSKVSVTVPPEQTVEIQMSGNSSIEYAFGDMPLGRSLRGLKILRFQPRLYSDKYIQSISSGQNGDLFQISPTCTGVDSFDVSLTYTDLPEGDSCTLRIGVPFSIAINRRDTIDAFQNSGLYELSIPYSVNPLEFIGPPDIVQDQPIYHVRGSIKSYYVYDAYVHNFVIASERACQDFQSDFLQVTSINDLPGFEQGENCSFTKTISGHIECISHGNSPVRQLDKDFAIDQLLSPSLSVMYCFKTGRSTKVPKVKD